MDFTPSANSTPTSKIQKIAIIGNYPPRRCGIATFTHDLSRAIRGAGLRVDVVAMDDGSVDEYPEEVKHRVDADRRTSYAEAAKWLNAQGYDAVCVQHEYGIFGGPSGIYLLDLLRALNMPIVTTLHTVLAEPNPEQKKAMDEILQLSERVVVMSRKGLELLRKAHGIGSQKIALVPHGIPDMPRDERESERERRGVGNRPLLMTFGLLSPDKGIEYAIEAMADVAKAHPEALYIFAGQTHPHIVKQHGEAYRESLQSRIDELGLTGNVHLANGYMDDAALGRLLAATDVYVTPYLKREQITSGTLSFAVGNGLPTVSTPYWHAEELLADGRGLLVPLRDAKALAEAMNQMLDDEDARQEMATRSLSIGQKMRWPIVGARYRSLFEEANADARANLRQMTAMNSPKQLDLPRVSIGHLVAMSDSTGMLQHATYDIPNFLEGYCTDDNARGLIATVVGMRVDEALAPALDSLQQRYLAFLDHALERSSGRFMNFMSFGRQWLETYGSNDSHGRAIWGLGVTAAGARKESRRRRAKELFEASIDAMAEINSPRAIAYATLGCAAIGKVEPWGSAAQTRDRLAGRLFAALTRNRKEDWPWPEPTLTYGNARIPQALILAGVATGREAWIEAGLESLAWLMEAQTGEGGVFVPVGNDGWWPQTGKKSDYDQQPIEAAGAVSACLEAHRATGEKRWMLEAERAFSWFLGQNSVGAVMVDAETGAGFDGLTLNGPNWNQGAESTLSYVTALCEMKLADSSPRVIPGAGEGYAI